MWRVFGAKGQSRVAVVFLLAAALTVLGVLGLLWVSQERLMFFPSRGPSSTPASVGLPFEQLRLVTADRIEVSAWWVPARESRGAVVFSHGNAGSMGNRLDRLRYLHGLGL